jgi:hypothetical protein
MAKPASKTTTPAAKKMPVVSYDARMAELASRAAKTEENVGGGTFISVKGGRLNYNGTDVPDNKLQCVIVDHILENVYYPGKYDPNNPTAPACFAFGRVDKDMKPHEKAAEPQNNACAGCPLNEFGSADTGRGKACKNSRRLALITEDALEESIPDATVAYLKVPVTSVKAFAAYVKHLSDNLKKPPLAVVTEISAHPDANSQFKLEFKLIRVIENDQLGALLDKLETVEREIDFPYVAQEEPATKKPAARGKFAPPAKKPAGRGR